MVRRCHPWSVARRARVQAGQGPTNDPLCRRRIPPAHPPGDWNHDATVSLLSHITPVRPFTQPSPKLTPSFCFTSFLVLRELTPIIFVLNNEGYEIEKQIHGVNRVYNDIQPYNHELLLPFLSPVPKKGEAPKHKYHRVSTRDELDALLKDEEFNKAGVIQLVEVHMPPHDAPRSLLTQAKLTEQANAKI